MFFTQEQASERLEHCLFMETKLFGLKPLELRLLALEFSSRNSILHFFEGNVADEGWHQGFMKRHLNSA
jgi:hypothetical protein